MQISVLAKTYHNGNLIHSLYKKKRVKGRRHSDFLVEKNYWQLGPEQGLRNNFLFCIP